MYRAFTFRLRPSKSQLVALGELLAFQREMYNAALEERRGAWEQNGRSVWRIDQYAQLTKWEDPRIDQFGMTVCRGSLLRVDRAFRGFFKRVKEYQEAKALGVQDLEKPGYPRFKSARRFESVEWTQANSWRFTDRKHLRIQGVGHVKLQRRKGQRWMKGVPKTLTVRNVRDGVWEATVFCKIEQSAVVHSHPESAVGVDVGIASFATLSGGERVENPRWYRAQEQKIVAKQRWRDTRAPNKGTVRNQRANYEVKRLHAKIACQRRDFHHKLSKHLVTENALVVVEELDIENMTKSPNPRPNDDGGFDPNGASKKAGLNKSILDAGWGDFMRMVEYKAADAGAQFLRVDPRYTSQTCFECGHVARENRVTQAEFKCVNCGHQAHADVNAAQNILRRGQRQQLVAREGACEAPSNGREHVAA